MEKKLAEMSTSSSGLSNAIVLDRDSNLGDGESSKDGDSNRGSQTSFNNFCGA